MEAPIRIDVVDNRGAAWPEGNPSPIEFEANIALAMHAVMKEEVNLTELAQQPRQVPSAGPSKVGPPITKTAFHRRTDLSLKLAIGRWEIDAPEMARAVALDRLQNEPRRKPVGHTRLDHLGGPQVAGQTPHGTDQPSIAVVPGTKTLRTYPQP